MNIETAKQINLADYLHSLGYSPVKQQGINLWYKSPLREETEASFKVNTERNQWYDFGLGKGGGIIELAAHLYATDHVPYLLERIAEQTPHVHPVSFSFGKQDSFGPSFQQLEIVPLSSPALLSYLQGRGINLELAKREGLENVYVHCFLDGRDTPPASGKGYVEQLVDKMKEIGVGQVATVMGRYYAMDRDNRWDRVELAYKALTAGEGNKGTSATELIQASYDDGKTDEFVVPAVVTGEDGNAIGTIKDNDSVIFFNFRPDRAREMTRAFCDDEFTGFARAKRIKTTYVCFVDYDETIPNKLVAFKKETIKNTLGEFLAAHGKTQARIAETEKYAHVTFFFNGGVEEPNPGEDRILVKSPKVATYDLQPEMSAPAVCEKLTDAIRSGKYDVIIVNFANPDMVGHTGVENAAVKAIEAVDECVGKAVEAIKEVDGVMFICADHGNAEQLIDYKTGEPWTAHTTNPVPFILVNAGEGYGLREGGCLADIAPTLIELMGMEQPKEMTGKSLLIRK